VVGHSSAACPTPNTGINDGGATKYNGLTDEICRDSSKKLDN
jgi:hypothetical protein